MFKFGEEMKLLKPTWVNHDGNKHLTAHEKCAHAKVVHFLFIQRNVDDNLLCYALGKPIFSIHIHPDGSKFATGGQGLSKNII